jgi:CheY-like chemotaxis protein
VVFGVTDTGIGIAEDKVRLVFDEFAQADASTTRDFGGTGLGLAITKRFCRMMGGDISVESTLGEGTTFTIRLPAEAPEKGDAGGEGDKEGEAVAAEGAAEQAGRGKTVLVIDDDAEARDLLKRFLEKEGYDVTAAVSGEEGLRLAKELRPAAITLDVMMPRMDGWAVIKALKGDPETAHIPVIIVSMVEDKSMGYTLGATEYVTKPIDRSRLLEILNCCRRPGPVCPVLVVEDDAPTREMIRRMLEKEGCAVAEAENGKAALERVAEKAPAVIILDLMMPVMDGFEFVLELRKKDAWRSIPVIVITAKDITEEDRRRLNGGIVDILHKGAFRREELLDQVRDFVTTCARAQGARTESTDDT